MQPLTDAEGTNFDTLCRVFENEDQALVRTVLAETIPAGTEIAVVASVEYDGEQFRMVPFAMMLPGDPFALLEDPTDAQDAPDA